MTSGKLASQVSHASRLSLLNFVRKNPHAIDEFIKLNSAGSVVVLHAKNATILSKIYEQAQSEGLPSALFKDSGHIMPPFFDGSPVITGLGLGPATKESMRHLTKKFNLVKEKLTMTKVLDEMKNCYQVQPNDTFPKGVNMLEHGLMVNQKYQTLIQILKGEILPAENWKVPSWLMENKELLLSSQLPMSIVSTYMVFHDCGKPFCVQEDENGRHYPNHAQKSAEIWLEANSDNIDNIQIAKLMRMDMDVHLLKSDGVEAFSKRKESLTLLLVGLAEIYANAEMFGGFDAVSFKIKYKHILKKGKQIISIVHQIKEKNDDSN